MQEKAELNSVPRLLEHYQNTLAGLRLWAGFDPLSIPLAIFDGDHTYLWQHPRPPEAFKKYERYPEVSVSNGRYAGLAANAFIEIEDVKTATILYRPEEATDLLQWAALLAHEAFHVYQQKTFKQKQANEADLFTYPVDRADLLTWRRLETYALSEALNAKDNGDKAAWGAAALYYRNERFAAMETAFTDYERCTELREGTALYIERKVWHEALTLPPDGFLATSIRQRCYPIGAALCTLLETFVTDWQTRLKRSGDAYLDTLLAEGIAGSSPKVLTEARWLEIQDQAHADIEQVHLERKRSRAAFDAFSGWRLTLLAAPSKPFKLQGFDPLNVAIIEGGVLHKRYLNLGEDGVQLEVFGASCLTQSFGEHPLYSGVRCATVQLANEPTVTEKAYGFQIEGGSIRADLAQATVSQKGRHITISLRD